MASGDFLLQWPARSGQPPVALYATIDFRNGRAVLDFDASVAEAMLFDGTLPPNYAGGGLTVMVTWTASTAIANGVTWGSSIERGNTDIDANSFATQQTANSTTNATSGIPTTTSITHSSGANMDSLAAGEPFWLQIQRVVADGGDTMAGDAELIFVVLRET